MPNVANEQAVSPLRRIFEGSYLPAQQSLPAAVSYNNYNNAGSMYSNAGNTNSAMRSSNIREYPEDIYRNSHDQSLHVRQTQEYFEGSHKLGTGIGMSGIGVNSNVIPMTTRKSIGDSSSEYLVDALLGPSASNYDNHYLSPGRMSFNDLYEKSNTNDNSLIHERRKSDPSLGVNMLNSGATFSPGDLFNQFASRDPPSQMNYSNIAPDGYSGQLGLFSAGNSSVLESTDQLDIFNVAKGNSLSRK